MSLSEHSAALTLPVAFILWYLTFQVNVLGFWDRITVSTSILLALSLAIGRREMHFKLGWRGASVGSTSAILLYLFFWTGYQVLRSSPLFLEQVSSVYLFRTGEPAYLTSLLIIFPLGPAEEFYWRGLIQRYLRKHSRGRTAIIATSALYASIHLPTLNPSLMFVALVGGLAWGYIFLRFENIFPSVLSHVIFDELIFVLLPIT